MLAVAVSNDDIVPQSFSPVGVIMATVGRSVAMAIDGPRVGLRVESLLSQGQDHRDCVSLLPTLRKRPDCGCPAP